MVTLITIVIILLKMKRRAYSLDMKAKNNRDEYNRRIFNKLTANDIKEHPEIYSAVNYDKKIVFDFLSSEKPHMIDTDTIKSERKAHIINNINSFRKVFFNYSNVEKKAFHNYRAIQRDNDIFSKQYTNVQKQKERYNSPEKQFAEIKEQYDKKGYKVPSLSLDHNIFNQNLLLLDGSDIEKYILFNHGSAKNQEKSMKYLDKLNEDMLTMQISGNNPDILGALNQKRHNQQMQEKMEEEKKKIMISPRREILKTKKEIKEIKSTFNNIGELDDFFSPLRNYYGNKGKLCSRESSGKYSTRVNSASKSNIQNIKHQNLFSHNRVISGIKEELEKIKERNLNLNIEPRKRSSIQNVYTNIFTINPKYKSCNNATSVPKSKTELESLYESVSNVENSAKYNDELKNYLDTHNYKITNDVSPRVIYQQIHNSRDKFFGKELFKNDIKLRRDKKANEPSEKEKIMLRNDEEMDRSLNECEKELCKQVYDIYK